MNVLLIPEDFRHDQYILGPLFNGILAVCGRPNAKVRVCVDPLLGGVTEAMKPERLDEIFVRYEGMVDIFILCVDRDAAPGREKALQALEQRYNTETRKLICVAAIEELETWLLAGCDLPREWRWQDIRAERDAKERYFLPLAKLRNLEVSPGQGRRILGREMGARVNRVLALCETELNPVVERIRAWL